jgi:hypothetical protein
MARLDAVLRDKHHMLKSRRVAILRHVFGGKGVVMVAHLITRMQEEPVKWTADAARRLGQDVQA